MPGRLLAALRLALMVAWLGLCIALYYAWRLFGRANPWPRVFLGGIAWIVGVDVRVDGVRARPGAVLLANHVSWMDIPALAAISGTAFVAHEGLAAVPVLRWLCAMNRTVFVARHDRASVAEQVAHVRAAIAAGGTLTIFPEGAIGGGSGLLPFKSSLLSALDPLPPGLVVQPVWLDYGPATAEIAWVGEERGLDNFLRILGRARPVPLVVHLLPPLAADALASRKTMAAAAHAAILQAMAA
jgi:1-acyl-sn-glycerol-3-phosphate acyltransferase